MDFLNNSWANMTQIEETVDSVGNTNQQFQLVVPKKGRTGRNKLRLVKFLKLVLQTVSVLNVLCFFSFYLLFSAFLFSLRVLVIFPLFLYLLFLLIYVVGVAVGDPSTLYLLLKKKTTIDIKNEKINY
jgi:hypothetical protein